MRPLDPADDGPLAAFASDLRELRRQAGNPPFRQLARHAHYSATTLSVACSGTALPSLEVTLAFARACGAPEQPWRERWLAVQVSAAASANGRDPVAAARTGQVTSTPPAPGAGPPLRTRTGSWRRRRPLAGFAALLLVSSAGLLAGYALAPAPAAQARFGITPCDPGSYPVRRAPVTLRGAVRIGGHKLGAGAQIGTVVLMYSPRCAEGWTHVSIVGGLQGAPGGVVLQTRSTQDNSTTTSSYTAIRDADSEPMLTIPGCVSAQATILAPGGIPVASASTSCFQFSN